MNQKIRFCQSYDGTRIAYATSGQGPAFVKAANYLSHLEYDWESPVWHHWLSELSRHHTLVRYDERGCGLSDWQVDELSLDAWVADLESVVDELELETFPLLGISQGGPVAIKYAVRHPERVSHLILYGTYAKGRFHRDSSQRTQDEANTFLKLIEMGWGQDTPAFRQVFTTLFMPEASPEQVDWFNELQRRSTSPENAVRLETAFYNIDVSQYLAQISGPTLVLHAEHDQIIGFEQGRILGASIPKAHFVALAGQNHILLEDEPAWQRFLAEVYQFIGVEVQPPRSTNPQDDDLREALTSRELDVLDLLAQGYRNAEIAERLFLSPKTVRNYLSNIFSKLDVADRGQAIIWAKNHGMGDQN